MSCLLHLFKSTIQKRPYKSGKIFHSIEICGKKKIEFSTTKCMRTISSFYDKYESYKACASEMELRHIFPSMNADTSLHAAMKCPIK